MKSRNLLKYPSIFIIIYLYYEMDWLESPSLNRFESRHVCRADYLYRSWCSKKQINEPYPLNSSVLEFIEALRLGENPYAISSVCSIVNSLKYKHLRETTKKTDDTLNTQIKNCIKILQLKKTKNDGRFGGQTPILYEDLVYMFNNVPTNYKRKEFYFSLLSPKISILLPILQIGI
jgi:hypothetical protein